MLSLLYALKSALTFGFYVSWKMGQFIVTFVTFVLGNAFVIFKKLLLLFRVMAEDFTFFLQDVCTQISQAIGMLHWSIEHLINLISTATKSIGNLRSALLNLLNIAITTVIKAINSIFNSIGLACILIKSLFVLFGEGIWFLITFIPLTIYHSSIYLIDLTRDICDYGHQKIIAVGVFISDLYNFVTDVPLESLMGLLTAMCLGYVLVQFHVVLCEHFRTKFARIYARLRRKCNYFKRRMLMVYVRRHELSRMLLPAFLRNPFADVRVVTKEAESDDDDRYCIICQENSRCILLMPCRHLCMCSECSFRLELYDATCPICRKDIEQTIKVFM